MVLTQLVPKLLSFLQTITKPCCYDVICSCQQVVAEANKPEWSGGHRGLQTYLQRLLHPTWDSRLVSSTKANPNSLMPNLNEETLKVSRVCIQNLKQARRLQSCALSAAAICIAKHFVENNSEYKAIWSKSICVPVCRRYNCACVT